MNKNFLRSALAASVAAATLPSYAVLDITAATTGITDATVAVVAVLAALIVMGAAFFGLKKVKRLIGG
jgi:hypothetical protein